MSQLWWVGWNGESERPGMVGCCLAEYAGGRKGPRAMLEGRGRVVSGGAVLGDRHAAGLLDSDCSPFVVPGFNRFRYARL